jgi:hypothetical protein
MFWDRTVICKFTLFELFEVISCRKGDKFNIQKTTIIHDNFFDVEEGDVIYIYTLNPYQPGTPGSTQGAPGSTREHQEAPMGT